MIVRTSKASRDRYVTIDVTASRDPRLSLRAVGLHTWLMTMADNWEIRMPWICQQRTEGRDALQAAFQELREAGYAILSPMKDPSGKAAGSQWVIYETATACGKPVNGFSGSRETRPPESQAAYKNDQKERTIKRERTIKSPPTPKGERDIPPLLELEQEETTDQSIEDLARKHQQQAKAKTEAMIDQIYAAYPRKVGRPAARKAILGAMKKAHPEQILEATIKYASTRKGEDANFTPHPATWFNQERWNDPTNPTPYDDKPRPAWLW